MNQELDQVIEKVFELWASDLEMNLDERATSQKERNEAHSEYDELYKKYKKLIKEV